MLEIISAYIEQHRLLPTKGTVVVAVSGGADSLCLLHLLYGLCGPGKRYPHVQLHVAHLNHQLRGFESDADACAVTVLAQELELPATIATCDVSALARQEHRSLEEAARIARYRFLRSVANGQPIAVAHHQDDQVETLLLHWLRGGGIGSMVGLQPRQQDIIRPLLCISRADTLAYCQQQGLVPLEDSSNSDLRFLRNRVRHELLPLLEELNTGFRATLLRNAETLRVDHEWIEEQVTQHWPSVVIVEEAQQIVLRRDALLQLPLSLQRHLLRRAMARLNYGQSPLELRHYALIEELLGREEVSELQTLHLPQQIRCSRYRDELRFTVLADSPVLTRSAQTTIALTIPGQVVIADTSWSARAEWLSGPLLTAVQSALRQADWSKVWSLLASTPDSVYADGDTIATTLHVRTRLPGDRIQPLGMTHMKKVQDVMIDKHIPREAREQIPLFFSADRCIWLAGITLDHRVRLTTTTQNIVRLSLIHTPSER